MDRIVTTSSEATISAYERRIAKLEKDKLIITEKLEASGTPRRSFDEQFEIAFQFLANTLKLWVSERLEDKNLVLKLTFARRLNYCRKKGFRTKKNNLAFQ